jgi:hypothetical protein
VFPYRVTAPVKISDVLCQRAGEKFGRAVCPARPQFLDIVPKVLEQLDRCTPEQFTEKQGRARARTCQGKVFASEQHEKDSLFALQTSRLEDGYDFDQGDKPLAA